MRLPSQFFSKISVFVFVCALALLIAVLIPSIGTSIGGARRWISFHGLTIQPSELMKLGLIFYLSVWLLKPRRFLSFAVLVGGIFGLVMLQPDLGSALIIGSIAVGMYFLSGKPVKHFFWLGGCAVLMLGILIAIAPYRLSRLTTFLNPDSDPLGKSYHIRQITIALANGNIFGQGLGQSKQKYRYIPEASTDSIFAIIAEEFGFIACTCILLCYCLLFISMCRYVQAIEGNGEKLLGTGIVLWVASQTIVNIASITALIPLTGVPLPFISYGGSSLVMTLAGVGILLGLGREKRKKSTISRV
jgi:cell division protein FtsW